MALQSRDEYTEPLRTSIISRRAKEMEEYSSDRKSIYKDKSEKCIWNVYKDENEKCIWNVGELCAVALVLNSRSFYPIWRLQLCLLTFGRLVG